MKTSIFTIAILLTLFTPAKLRKCKYFRSKNHYSYPDFHDLEKFDTSPEYRGSELLRLKFNMPPKKGAFIYLANDISGMRSDKQHYVIDIDHSSSRIYQNVFKRKTVLARKAMNKLLSVTEPTAIEVIQTRGNGTEGKLTINLIGVDEPHLEWTDSNRIDITYVKFGSFGSDNSTDWSYDCLLNSNAKQRAAADDENEIENRTLIGKTKLIKDLPLNCEMTPEGLENVMLNYVLKGDAVKYKYGVLFSRSGLFMTWTDPRLQWLPSNYGNLTSFEWHTDWKPKRHHSRIKSITGYFQSTIYHNGTVTASSDDALIECNATFGSRLWCLRSSSWMCSGFL